MATRAEVEAVLEDPTVVLVLGADGADRFKKLAERDVRPGQPTYIVILDAPGGWARAGTDPAP